MDNNHPSISVAIITRNRFPALSECVKSLLRQSLIPKEILIIDSESQDQTKDIALASPLIKYLRIPHKGVAYARNKAIDAAKEDYLAFIDDDCLADIDWLKNLYSGLIQENSDLAGGNSYFFDAPGKLQYSLNRVSAYGECLTPQDHNWTKLRTSNKFKQTFLCTLNILLKKELCKKLRFDEYYSFWLEDADFFIRAQQMGNKAVLVEEAFVLHKNAAGEQRINQNLTIFRNTAYFVAKNLSVTPGYLAHLACSFFKIIRNSYRPENQKNIGYFISATYQGIRDGRKAKKAARLEN